VNKVREPAPVVAQSLHPPSFNDRGSSGD